MAKTKEADAQTPSSTQQTNGRNSLWREAFLITSSFTAMQPVFMIFFVLGLPLIA